MLIQTTEVFGKWLYGLRDRRAKAKIAARLESVQQGNLGDCQPVGKGVSEMRIHYGPGYRIYFIRSEIELIVLLGGGTKKTQSKDIEKALEAAEDVRAWLR